MSNGLFSIDNLRTSEMVVASGTIGGVAIPPALTPSAGPHAMAGAVLSKVYSLTAAQLQALGAIQTATLEIATLPAKTLLTSVLCVLKGAPAGVTTLLFSLGFDAGGPYQDYFNQADLVAHVAGDLLAKANTTGSGAKVGEAAIPSLTSATPVKAVLTCSTGAETFATLTDLELDIYFDSLVLP